MGTMARERERLGWEHVPTLLLSGPPPMRALNTKPVVIEGGPPNPAAPPHPFRLFSRPMQLNFYHFDMDFPSSLSIFLPNPERTCIYECIYCMPFRKVQRNNTFSVIYDRDMKNYPEGPRSIVLWLIHLNFSILLIKS